MCAYIHVPLGGDSHSNGFHSGYLMRLAYELGFANATLFCRGPVRFFSLDKISFVKPVSIGSILRLRSTIIHSTASEKYPAIVVSTILVIRCLNLDRIHVHSTFASKPTL